LTIRIVLTIQLWTCALVRKVYSHTYDFT